MHTPFDQAMAGTVGPFADAIKQPRLSERHDRERQQAASELYEQLRLLSMDALRTLAREESLNVDGFSRQAIIASIIQRRLEPCR